MAVSLAPVGAPGCTLNVDPALIEVLVGDPSGVATYTLNIPGNQALKGAAIYQQACKWGFATPVNALGIQPGGHVRYIIGDRGF